MSAGARRNFDAQDITIACCAAVVAQLAFVAVFSMPSPKLVQMDISNENAQPIAVSITPVLKLGSKSPNAKLPSQWMRKQPVAAKTQPPPQSAAPSTKAEKTPSAAPTTTATSWSIYADAGTPQPAAPIAAPEGSAPATAASTQGAENGSENGTETDPLKARAADMYKAQLAQWVMARFDIKGKVPFETLKTLRAVATVSVEDRKVTSFSIVKPSGDSTFDGEVTATLQRIQSSGAELPAPPPMYPEMLAKSQTFSFQCTIQKLCE